MIESGKRNEVKIDYKESLCIVINTFLVYLKKQYMSFRDKNNVVLDIDDFICLESFGTAFKIIDDFGIGIKVPDNSNFPLKNLKENYRKIGNTQGFIPLHFLEQEKIMRCNLDKYPECHV